MSSSAFAIGKVLRDASVMAARNAALDAVRRRGMNGSLTPRINQREGNTRRGIGFLESGGGDYFDDYGYYDDYGGGWDYWFGGDGGLTPDTPVDWAGNTDVFAWDWDANTNYWDEENQGWWDTSDDADWIFTDSDGSRYLVDPFTGDSELIGFTEPTTDYGDVAIANDGSVNLLDLQNTLDWWNEISGDPELTAVVLPNVTYDAGYILNTPADVIFNNPQAPKLPNGQKLPIKAIQALQNALKKAASKISSSGGTPPSSAKPQTVPPKADGTCPTGYAKHPQTGKCTLIPASKQGTGIGELLSNPFFLLGAGILIAVLAKK